MNEQTNREADIAAVNGVWKEYVASVNEGDADRWASLWAEDGVQMQPGIAPVLGKQQIRDTLASFMDQFTFHQEITIVETEITGSWAFSRGMFGSTLTPKGEGQAVLIDGKFMTVLKRQTDGRWKIYRDIWNSNLPAGG